MDSHESTTRENSTPPAVPMIRGLIIPAANSPQMGGTVADSFHVVQHGFGHPKRLQWICLFGVDVHGDLWRISNSSRIGLRNERLHPLLVEFNAVVVGVKRGADSEP